MVCQPHCHRGSSVLPFSALEGASPSYSQRKMWTNKIDYCVLQIDGALQV
jgi:hypothetical protein